MARKSPWSRENGSCTSTRGELLGIWITTYGEVGQVKYIEISNTDPVKVGRCFLNMSVTCPTDLKILDEAFEALFMTSVVVHPGVASMSSLWIRTRSTSCPPRPTTRPEVDKWLGSLDNSAHSIQTGQMKYVC